MKSFGKKSRTKEKKKKKKHKKKQQKQNKTTKNHGVENMVIYVHHMMLNNLTMK